MSDKINSAFLDKLDDIIQKAIEAGGLLTIGSKGMGKSNANMWLMRRMMDSPKHETNEYKILVMDDVMNWQYTYDKIPYINYNGLYGLPLAQDLIVNFNMIDPIDVRNAISQIMMQDFQQKMSLKQQLSGQIPFWNIYFVEEVQNIWGTYGLNGLAGRFAFKTIAEGRNYGMAIFGIGQRLSDISTKFCERIRYYLFGATSGQNDLMKIRRIGGKEVSDAVNGLERGSFLYFDKDDSTIEVIGFPLFQQMSKPYEVIENRKNGFVRLIFKGK